MKPVYFRYEQWEDFQAGMFEETCGDADAKKEACRVLLRSNRALYDAMYFVSQEWWHSAEMNLTNSSRNHQAWLGQAACCYMCGAPDFVTKMAWHELSDAERGDANAVADRVVEAWKQNYIGVLHAKS